MESIVFIDSEITNEGVVADLGAVKETAQFHSANKLEFSNFVKNLPYMGKGMLGILIVMGLIILTTVVLNKVFKSDK